MINRLIGLKISASNSMPEDKWVLMYGGQIVSIVPRGSPIEDAVFDEIIMSESDYEKIKNIPMGKKNDTA